MSGARLFSLLGLALLFACGRDVPDGGRNGGALTLFIEPPTLDLYLDQPFTFDVALADEEATRSVLGAPELDLALGRPGIVDVKKDGTGTAKAAGTTALIASYLGFQAEANVNVRGGRLVSIEVFPPSIRLAIGQNTQIRVTGTLDNGQELDLTRAYQGTRYGSSDESIASVSKDGVVLAQKPGTASIEVTHGRFSRQVNVEVTDAQAQLTSIYFDPPQISIEFNQSVQLGVFGIDTNGNTVDLVATFPTYPVGFTSSDPTIATVNETALVSALRRSGVTTIIAKLGDLTASAEVRVRPPESELIDILVQPDFAQLAVGEELQLIVTGFYLDGSTADLTLGSSGTFYLSSDGSAFSVDGDGRVRALRRASGFVSVRHGVFERLAFIDVVDQRELLGIEVRPFSLELTVGGGAQLQVLAYYTDGSIVDVTHSSSGVQYIPPPEGFVTVDRNGFVRASFAGAGTLLVQFRGFTIGVGVTVIDQMQIAFISIDPGFITVAQMNVARYTVWAHFIDGSVRDITNDPALLLFIDNPVVAGSLGPGLVQGMSPGFTTLIAFYFGFGAQADIEVTGTRMLTRIELSIPPQIGVNQTVPYRVLGIYNDGTSQDITFHARTQVVSINPSILTVLPGFATGLRTGTTQVIADHLGFSDSVFVEVTNTADPIVALNFQPSMLSIPVGGLGFASLIAVRQSGRVIDVTFEAGVLYSSSGPISATLGAAGLEVIGFANGLGEVVASYQGLTARLSVDVGSINQLVGIEVVAPAQIPVGSTDFFLVIAFFSDGTFQDVTFDAQLRVVSSNPNVLAVSTGSFSGVAVGTADIVATYRGFTDAHTVSVGNDPVIGLEFVPPSLTMQLGVRASAQVIARFASGRTANVTFDPGLLISFNGPILLLPGPGATILIDAFAIGMASIDVSYRGFTAFLPITIQNSRILTGITLIAPAEIQLGTSGTYRVSANFSDGSTQDVTIDPAVIETVADPSILTANNGVITAHRVGRTTLTVSYLGFSDSEVIEVVNPDAIIALSWIPSQLNLQIGQSATANVVALFRSGNTIDVTNDPATMLTSTGPITAQLAGPNLRITGNAQGNGQVTAFYMGFSAGLPVTVGSAPQLIGIRVQPPVVQLAEGDSVQLVVIGRFSDGSEAPISGASFFNFDPTVADVSPNGLVTGISAGTGAMLVTFGNFAELVQIDVFSPMGPTITSIAPEAIEVGSPATQLTVNGTGFVAGDAVFVAGTRLTTTFVSSMVLRAQVPSFLLAFPGTLDVQVRGANGRSNLVPLLVGEAPNVTSYSPNSVFVGSSIVVTIIGSGLTDLSYAAPGLTIQQLEVASDGTWVRIRITAPAMIMPGPYTVTLSNPLGTDSIAIEVRTTQNLPSLVVAAGQTVTLSGTNVYSSVTVQTGGRIVGTGLDTLAIIASSDITIRGTIDVSGSAGEPGFTNPADGGAAGPGGAGGGGAGDGNATRPANGGAGSPPGFDAVPGFGSGTPGGDGGGEGGGGAGAFGCGHGGGGGGLGGNGGDGGGDFGPGTGGFGGLAGGRGSSYGNGTGGGGGSTCGNDSGGGGGGGGGGLILQVASGGSILIDGAIRADGGKGGDGFQSTGGGGGGSGGRVEVIAPNGQITVNDTISARGGNGGNTDFGDTGGGGGGGIIIIDATGGSANVGLGLLDVDGGRPGLSLGNGFPGEAGSNGIITVLP